MSKNKVLRDDFLSSTEYMFGNRRKDMNASEKARLRFEADLASGRIVKTIQACEQTGRDIVIYKRVVKTNN
jgi:hypothetical protein